GAAEHLLDVEAVGHERHDLAAKDVVHVEQAVGVHVEGRHVGAETDRRARRVEPRRARAENNDVAGRDAGHAGQQYSAPAVGATEVERALLHREPSRHLAHRGEERQAPVGALDRLVGDRDRPRVAERPRQLGRRREVKVGEEDLARAEPRGLRRERLLDLQDELGALPDLVGRHERSPDGGVLVVADPAAAAGAVLDLDAVAGLGEGARALAEAGHRVEVEHGAGGGSGIRDDEYATVGAALVTADEVWQRAELVLKVKEPLPAESARLRPGQILLTYLHLAPAPELARALRDSGAIAIAYETVQRADGSLPLLTPMSEVAGRLSVQEGAFYLGRARGGRGILLSGVPGVPPGNVAIIGAGVVGVNAARIAIGLGADVSILDVNPDRLRAVDDLFGGRVVTIMSNTFNLQAVVRRADLLVGAVLITGARAPVLVTAAMVATMKEGAVIVDVAVDQGGCVETVHPTTLLDPVYVVSGVVHYGVANMPALVPHTSTFALTNATLPYVLELATRGVAGAARANAALAKGINVARGRVVHPAVAASLGEPPAPLDSVLG